MWAFFFFPMRVVQSIAMAFRVMTCSPHLPSRLLYCYGANRGVVIMYCVEVAKNIRIT